MFKCAICNRYYKKKRDLEKHYLAEHSAIKLHERARIYKKQQEMKEKIEKFKRDFNYI